MSVALFWLFAILACGGAISVVLCQNVSRMAASLILCFSSVAVLYFLLGADFVGATQLMVYVGGTVVLLIFGIMLTSSGPAQQLKASPADGFLAAGIGVLFLAIVAFTIGGVDWAANSEKLAAAEPAKQGQLHEDLSHGMTTRPLALALMGVRPDKPGAGGYLLPFEIVSVHLLVVLIGAAYLARTKRRVVENQ